MIEIYAFPLPEPSALWTFPALQSVTKKVLGILEIIQNGIFP